jgi:hypothetical protein
MSLPKWIKTKIACANCVKPIGNAPGVLCEACERRAKEMGLK